MTAIQCATIEKNNDEFKCVLFEEMQENKVCLINVLVVTMPHLNNYKVTANIVRVSNKIDPVVFDSQQEWEVVLL